MQPVSNGLHISYGLYMSNSVADVQTGVFVDVESGVDSYVDADYAEEVVTESVPPTESAGQRFDDATAHSTTN